MAQKWAVVTSLKAKVTAQTIPYKTALHPIGAEDLLALLVNASLNAYSS